MNEWIKCGLTWNDDSFDQPMPDSLIPDERVIARFGATYTEMMELHTKLYDEHNQFVYEDDSPSKNKLGYDGWWSSIVEREKQAETMDQFDALRKQIALVEEHYCWQEEQPEAIEFKRKQDEKRELGSFVGHNLNKPGTLIEVKVGDIIKQHLIGHINKNAGVCDDCRQFENDAVVVRYKVIWDPDAPISVVLPQEM